MEPKEIVVFPDGKIGLMYDDGVPEFAEALGASLNVTRASTIEWDNELKGWVVRSASDPTLAIRHLLLGPEDIGVGRCGWLVVFKTRELALAEEKKLFWKLLEKYDVQDR